MPSPAPLDLVLGDGTRVALAAGVTLGRDRGSTVVLADPSVSRAHARVLLTDAGGPMIEDAGSSYGTFLDGVRVRSPAALRDGSELRLGDTRLVVERRRDAAEAGSTIVVPSGDGAPTGRPGGAGVGPRVRAGYALKRLEAAEGSRRWVLKDLETGAYLRLGDTDARLFEQLDGSRSVADLITASEQLGPTGPARLVRLLADLGERGFLEDVQGESSGTIATPQRWYRRILVPHVRTFAGVGEAFAALYRRAGWVLFTRPALAMLAVLAAVGVGVFAYLVAGRYGTPFVVASKIGLGGLVFLLGRLAVVVLHELAHGLAMASYGRRVEKAGVKLVAIFPYAFVDTSEAWFEPRRRRIAISAAGPASDFAVGAVFAIACLQLPPGALRDICFQLAFAAYVGAFFNLNPFLDRDGYHILVDVLREPGLRRRAREQLTRRLSGAAASDDSPVLARYAAWGLAWSCLAAVFAIAMTLRYRSTLEAFAPEPWIAWTVLATIWVMLFVPVLVVLRPAIAARPR